MQKLESLEIGRCNHASERGKGLGENVRETPENKIEGLTNGSEETKPQKHVNDPAPEEPSGQDN